MGMSPTSWEMSRRGAREGPLVLLQLGNSGEYDALIAIGTIIKGETYHFEVVCNESAAGVSRVSLELGIPVANAILTTYNEEQARPRPPAGAPAPRCPPNPPHPPRPATCPSV